MIPVRQCIGCKKRRKQGEMIRFTLTAGGKARMVEGKNRTGRGVYICPNGVCLKMAKKRHYFNPVPETRDFEEGFKEKSLEGV